MSVNDNRADLAKQGGETSPITEERANSIPLGSLPAEMVTQLTAMRRNPADFWLRGRAACSLGCDRKGERSAYQIAHGNAPEAGSWCPVHGWLSFDSVALPPTERLTPVEIEDNRLAAQRQREFARRKAVRQ